LKDIRPALRRFLLDDAAVSALVGGSRIFPIRLTEGEKRTSLVYHRISELTDYHLLGPSGLEQARFQLDALAQTSAAASELSDAVQDRLSGASGTVTFGSNSPEDFVEFRGVFKVHAREEFDGEAELFRMSRDYLIWYMAV
jgi:Protein of unknown function (DUF3168)